MDPPSVFVEMVLTDSAGQAAGNANKRAAWFPWAIPFFFTAAGEEFALFPDMSFAELELALDLLVTTVDLGLDDAKDIYCHVL